VRARRPRAARRGHRRVRHDRVPLPRRRGTHCATSELPRLAGPDTPGTVGVLRPALHAILLGAAERADVRVRLGTTVQALDSDGAAELSDGTSGRYDAIVGADGIRSRVRPRARRRPRAGLPGVVVWRALLDRPTEVDAFHLYNAPARDVRLCPVSDARLYLFAVEPQPEFARVEAEREPELMRGLLRDLGGLAGVLRDRIVEPGHIVRPRSRRCSCRRRGTRAGSC
jgi:2-polyprenyl-6-methoxyphenol hydroxylase-like FAD-dependent oxidoreductase